jgi:hypothetical protein
MMKLVLVIVVVVMTIIKKWTLIQILEFTVCNRQYVLIQATSIQFSIIFHNGLARGCGDIPQEQFPQMLKWLNIAAVILWCVLQHR